MADNYLEKQREQYEARKAAWLQAKKYGKKKKMQPASKPQVARDAGEKSPEEE